jgi:alkanesulfonate monooxygenase SsuD/methylene tetrahydromethanopterin reductase-like flavin-dependent oxidoreductase (luciferase family)
MAAAAAAGLFADGTYRDNTWSTAAFRGTDAVFEVVGDPEPVVDGYRKQLEHADFFPVRPPFSDPVPGTGPTTRMYQEGDGSAEAVTIPGPSGTTYLRLGVHPE